MLTLLLSNRRDLTTDFLVRELTERGVNFYRLNTDTIANMSFVMDPVRRKTEIVGRNFSIDTDDISVAYFRRPSLSVPKHVIAPFRNYVTTEWTVFLAALYSIVGDRWFNHPRAILQAEDKARQLRLAHQIGFLVPETRITNDLAAIRQLQRDFPLIAKPMKQALIEEENAQSSIFTSPVESLTENDSEDVSICPIIFQQHIPKTLDIRVTVVGNKVFSVAIDSQSTEETKVDWRRGSNPNLHHEIITLPKQIANYCIEIVRLQGLRFGAIDLAKSQDGLYWFLECNPNGQWAWSENRTGLPIAAAIADELIKIARKC